MAGVWVPRSDAVATVFSSGERSRFWQALQAMGLIALMERTAGAPEVAVALLDGPIRRSHPLLGSARIIELAPPGASRCSAPGSEACRHGTFLAGVLVAARGGGAPAICPGCTLLQCPIFDEGSTPGIPMAAPEILADRVIAAVDARADVIVLSCGFPDGRTDDDDAITAALDHAARHEVIVVAAAGNVPVVTSSPITRHPWVVSVVASDARGHPTSWATVSRSAGVRGVCAPGVGVPSLEATGGLTLGAGSSVAAAIVAGAIALLRSVAPSARASDIRRALNGRAGRFTVVPPMLRLAWPA